MTYTLQPGSVGASGSQPSVGSNPYPILGGSQLTVGNGSGGVTDTVTGQAQRAQQTYYGSDPNANLAAGQAANFGLGAASTDTGLGQNAYNNYINGGFGYGQILSGLGNQYAGQFGSLANSGLNLSGYNAATAQNQNALGLLGSAAAGNGPSAAQAQLQAGTDAAIQAQLAAANSSRGGFGQANAGLAASQNAAVMEQQAANNAAILRAQEQQAAQQQYLQGTSAAQGSALGAANAGAQYQLGALGAAQNAAFQGAQGAANTQLGYSNAGNQTQLAYEQLGQGTGLGGLQLANTTQGTAGSIGLGNQGIVQGVNTTNAKNSQDFWGGMMNMAGGLVSGLGV